MQQRSIGRYRIIEQIASGGQATVYLARDPGLQGDVAPKVLHPHFSLKTVDIGPGLHYLQKDNPHLIGSELAGWYSRS